MGLFLEVMGAMVGAGLSRARGAPRPVVRVQQTPWLAVGLGATLANIAILVVATWLTARFTLQFLQDDLLGFLAVLFLPVALAGIAAALAVSGRMIGTVRRLLARDASARGDLAVAGVAGLLIVVFLASTVSAPTMVLLLVPSLTSVVVALNPMAWQPVELSVQGA